MQVLAVAEFDWDEGNRAKCAKHGISVLKIEVLFRDGPLVAPDLAHSGAEDRFIAVGRTRASRPVFVAFTLRERDGQTFIRPISARYMHRKEIEAYEKASPPAEE